MVMLDKLNPEFESFQSLIHYLFSSKAIRLHFLNSAQCFLFIHKPD